CLANGCETESWKLSVYANAGWNEIVIGTGYHVDDCLDRAELSCYEHGYQEDESPDRAELRCYEHGHHVDDYLDRVSCHEHY
ncbi:Uncharacterized protein APZ42_008574, partial [Daphnia magna]